MPSPIRDLLARAQDAEIRKDVPEAIRLLREAQGFFTERGQTSRAEQMRRHVARLTGEPSSDLGFGDELTDAPVAEPSVAAFQPTERGPAKADPAIDAWCSFCCRPKGEVGALVAGPAGAFVCKGCVAVAAVLFGGEAVRPLPAPEPVTQAQAPRAGHGYELPTQRKVRERWERRKPRVGLLLGPEGAGKSTVLRSLGDLHLGLNRLHQVEGDTLFLDVAAPMTTDDESRLVEWLVGKPHRRVLIAARGGTPEPLLIMRGPNGDEPVYDTPSLERSLQGVMSSRLLAQVDDVASLEAPNNKALYELAVYLLDGRGIVAPSQTIDRLVAHAVRTGRGAHELKALISRVPAGHYT